MEFKAPPKTSVSDDRLDREADGGDPDDPHKKLTQLGPDGEHPDAWDKSPPGLTLLEQRAAFDRPNFEGHTALHAAAQAGQIVVVDWLLSHQAAVDPISEGGVTPLHLAAEAGHALIVDRLLAKGARIDACTHVSRQSFNGRQSALYLAARHGHEDVVRLLVERRADSSLKDVSGATALHEAAGRGHASIVSTLLDAGAAIDDADYSHLTALHAATLNKQEAALRALLSRGARSDLMTLEGTTPLHCAASIGWLRGIELLVASKASIDAPGKRGTPLEVACQRGNFEAAVRLWSLGARPDARAVLSIVMQAEALKDAFQAPTIDGVMACDRWCELLVGNPDWIVEQNDSISTLERLALCQVCREMLLHYRHEDAFLQLALGLASRDWRSRGSVKLALYCLALAVRASGRSLGTLNPETALLAPEFERTLYRQLSGHAEHFERYQRMERRLDALQQRKPVEPALIFAIRERDVWLMRLLLSAGASPYLPGADGKSPMQVATALGYEKAVGLLRNCAATAGP